MSTLAPLSEKSWQIQVVALAEALGWQTAHFPTVTTVRKGRDGAERFVPMTPSQGSLGAGWPDLVLARERIIFAELKADKGRVSEAQSFVLATLAETGAETYVWRPKDFEFAREVLTRRRVPA